MVIAAAVVLVAALTLTAHWGAWSPWDAQLVTNAPLWSIRK